MKALSTTPGRTGLALGCLLILAGTLGGQSWTTPEKASNNLVFDQFPTIDIGAAPSGPAGNVPAGQRP